MLQYSEARSELKAHFKAFVENALTVGISGEFGQTIFTDSVTNEVYTPKIQWEAVEAEESQTQSKHWLRFNSQDTICNQGSLAGIDAKTIWDTKGLISVQLFFSKVSYNTIQADRLKRICQKAFQGRRTANGIWFRGSVIVDLSAEDSYFRSAVNAEYLYQSRN